MVDFLLDVDPSPREKHLLRSKVAATQRLHGKERFAGKLTGPARIRYFSEIFPDALFVHVVRDPRAVVESLMRVSFWRDTFRYRQPAWRGGLTAEDMSDWDKNGDSPVALAAIEWRAVIERARDEAEAIPTNRYLEIRYEDFVADPHTTLDNIFAFSGLPDTAEPHSFVADRLQIRDLTEGWKKHLTDDEIHTIERLTQSYMEEFDYASFTSRS